MDDRNALHRAWKMQIEGNRPAEGPQKRWIKNVREDMGLARLKEENPKDRALLQKKI